MTGKPPTGWESPDRSPGRLARLDHYRIGRHVPDELPLLYPFPIDFLDEERLKVVLGALCREAAITEVQARYVAALLAGYGSSTLIAHRLGVSQSLVKKTIFRLRKRFGFASTAHLVTAFWPIYEGLRGSAYLLPRVEPYELPEEEVHVRNEQTPDRGFPQ